MAVTTIGELYSGQILLEASGVLYTVNVENEAVQKAPVQEKMAWFKPGMFVRSTPDKNKRAERLLLKELGSEE